MAISESRMPGSGLMIAGQIVYMVSGYAMHIAITRLLGPEDYGTWGILISLLIWFELSVMIGFPKWTTKQIAEEPDDLRRQQIKTISLLGQGIAAMILGCIFYLLAASFSSALNDPALELLLKISAFDIPLYGLYFVNFGIINGLKGYRPMALLMAIYGISKAVYVAVIIFAGYGLTGAAVGNVLSSVTVLAISCVWVGKISLKLDGTYRLRDFFSFGIPSTIFILGFALLHQVDFLVLKSVSSDKHVVGFYLLAMMLAKVPYFIVEATSKSLFSEMSYQAGLRNRQESSRIMSDYIYATLLIFSLIITVTLVNSQELILLIFPATYLESAPFLKLLILSNSLVGMTYLLSQTLFVFNREKLSFILIFGLLALAFPLNVFLIERFGPMGAAISSFSIFGVGSLLFLIVNLLLVRMRVPLRLLLTISIAAAATVLLSLPFHPQNHVGYFLKPALSTTVFILTLLLLKEPTLTRLTQKLFQSRVLKR